MLSHKGDEEPSIARTRPCSPAQEELERPDGQTDIVERGRCEAEDLILWESCKNLKLEV